MPYVQGNTSQSNSGLPEVVDVYHSGNVFANFVPAALWQDAQGTEASIFKAMATLSFSPNYATDSTTVNNTEGEVKDPTAVANAQQSMIQDGTITQDQLNAGNNPKITNTDNSPAGTTTATTTGTVVVGPSVDDTLLCIGPYTGTSYYVRTVTKKPNVLFEYDVATISPQNGTTVQAVCDNLRLLIINCYDPIKAHFPDTYMTCSFRAKGVGAPNSQHIYGMACDIQYGQASKADYFTRAQWIKNNIAFDQFILEYKTTGSGLPWHHISFNSAGNRKQIFTFMNDHNCKGPGVTGLYDLSTT